MVRCSVAGSCSFLFKGLYPVFVYVLVKAFIQVLVEDGGHRFGGETDVCRQGLEVERRVKVYLVFTPWLF